MNNITTACGFQEKLILKDAKTLELKQTQPFIPNEDDIEQYIKVITSSYNKNNTEFHIHACRFSGYEYIYIISQDIACMIPDA